MPRESGCIRHAAAFTRLILRSIAKRCVSKDEAASWFETRRFATLLTMRPNSVTSSYGLATCQAPLRKPSPVVSPAFLSLTKV